MVFVMLTTLFFLPAYAEELFITTEFTPSAGNQSHDQFTNTTPITGFCSTYPQHCKNGAFSVRTSITAQNRVLNYQSPDIRDQTYQRVDGTWRTIILYDRITRKETTALFRINLLSLRFTRSANSWDNYSFNTAGPSPIGNCIGTAGMVNSSTYEYAWIHPDGHNICHKPLYNINYNNVNIDRVSIGYELISPNPMTTPNGDYIGSISYNVGNNGQIDLGNAVYSDDELKITIKATVKHDFKVEPKGKLNIPLEPDGGWDSVKGGVTETRLSGRSSFALTASTPFGMYAECQYSNMGSCALMMEGSNETVPLNVLVTMPGMRSRMTGEMVNDMHVPMKTDHIPQFIIDPVQFGNAVESPIEFSINAPASRRMLAQPGSKWKGTVTLVFDSELPFSAP